MIDERVRPDGVAVLRPVGRLNKVSAAPLRERISELVEQGHTRVALDLAGMEFIDSAGLVALIVGLKAARQAGGDLRISAPNPQVQLVLSLTHMGAVLPPYADAESAFD